MVRRRPHEPVPQRRRPASRRRAPTRRRSSISRRRRARSAATPTASLHATSTRSPRCCATSACGRGDRVLIYMPMIPEAVFAMLACVRIGAIHSVVFGGFAAASLATRIDDARPKVMITADAGMRGGKAVPYKHLVDEACRIATHPPARVLIVDRGIDRAMPRVAGRDLDYATLRRAARGRRRAVRVARIVRPVVHPLHLRHHRQAEGRAARHRRLCGRARGVDAATSSAWRPARRCSRTSDIGWVVGHSYIVYAPLLNGSTTIMYEGLPIRPDPAIWWKIVAEQHRAKSMFSSPTAIRVLKKQDPAFMRKHDIVARSSTSSSPASRSTSRPRAGSSDALGVRDRRQLLADRNRAGRSCRRSPASRTRRASSAARRSRRTATTCGCCARRRARKPARTRRACWRSCRRCRRAA